MAVIPRSYMALFTKDNVVFELIFAAPYLRNNMMNLKVHTGSAFWIETAKSLKFMSISIYGLTHEIMASMCVYTLLSGTFYRLPVAAMLVADTALTPGIAISFFKALACMLSTVIFGST